MPKDKPDRFIPTDDQLHALVSKDAPAAENAERGLLSCLMQDHRIYPAVAEALPGNGAESFYHAGYAALYAALSSTLERGGQPDPSTLEADLRQRGYLDGIGGVNGIIEIWESEAGPCAEVAIERCRVIAEAHARRSMADIGARMIHNAHSTKYELDKLVDFAGRDVLELSGLVEGKGTGVGMSSTADIMDEVNKAVCDPEAKPAGIPTDYPDLDRMITGLVPGDLTIIGARPSIGKAQPLDSMVLTRDGWQTMGKLRIGDELASVDGKPSRVTGIYPQGGRQVYRVTLADGRSAECCAEHLWRVHYRTWDEPRVVDTNKLVSMLNCKRYQNRLWIETFSGEFGTPQDFDISPWLMGALIGNGILNGGSPRFSSGNTETVERLIDELGCDFDVKPIGGSDYRITQKGGANRQGVKGVSPNPLKESLKVLGLWGCHAQDVFIPELYMKATRSQRAGLLAGLLDTNGWVDGPGGMRFSTASKKLADGVIELMRSLGGMATYKVKETTSYMYLGQRMQGRTAYVFSLYHDQPNEFVSVGHKAEKLRRPRTRKRRLNIVSIQPTRTAETQCIAVSHPDRLYITDGYTVTHNTALALNIAANIAMPRADAVPTPIGFFSMEMSKQQLAERLLSRAANVPGDDIRKRTTTSFQRETLAHVSKQIGQAPIVIDDTPGMTLMQLRNRARRMVIEHGVKVLFVDYLQLMSDPGKNSRQEEVSSLSRGIKAIARELNVPVVCLSQLSRASEGRTNHRPRMSDLRESGAIEQDADVIWLIHREDYYHKEADYTPNNTAEVIIEKQRNGPTGVVRLHWDGVVSRFTSAAREGQGEQAGNVGLYDGAGVMP